MVGLINIWVFGDVARTAGDRAFVYRFSQGVFSEQST